MTVMQEAFKQAQANKSLEEAEKVFEENPQAQTVVLRNGKWVPEFPWYVK